MLVVANYTCRRLVRTNYIYAQYIKTAARSVIMLPLVYAEVGEPQIIRKIGGSPEMKKHLEDMGFTVGGEMSVVSSIGENLIVKVKESRVAVSEELAKKIMV